MSEVVYSKKQIEPLIKKYAINQETNTLFKDIINMFLISQTIKFGL